jgi:hypothetical protein
VNFRRDVTIVAIGRNATKIGPGKAGWYRRSSGSLVRMARRYTVQLAGLEGRLP